MAKDESGNPTGIKTKDDNVTPRDPVGVGTTTQLTMENDSINLNGGVVFDNRVVFDGLQPGTYGLQPGTYWIKEIEVPDGYTINDNFVKVIVDGTGVYADAGKENDGIQVTRGVGRLVRSMLQFAVDDRIDVTLHNIVATLQTGKLNEEDGTWSWDDVQESDEGGLKQLHLRYTGGNEQGHTLDYEPEVNDEGKPINSYSFTVDTGIPRLEVKQCQDTQHVAQNGGTKQKLGNTDLTNLYTGTTVVHIADDPLANLEIVKKVTGLPEGTDIPDDAAFTFTVTATGGTAAKVLKYGSQPDATAVKAGSYYLADANGRPLKSGDNQLYAEFKEKPESNPLKVEATVTILGSYFKADQTSTSITILGLPVGQYTVTESTDNVADIGDYYFADAGYAVGTGNPDYDATNQQVTLSAGGSATVTVTNKYEAYKVVTIVKMVDGDMGDTTQPFAFTTSIQREDHNAVDIKQETVQDNQLSLWENGPKVNIELNGRDDLEGDKAHFTTDGYTLANNEKIVIEKVKKGDVFTVRETTESSAGYDVTYTASDGTSINNNGTFSVGDGDVTVTVKNTRNVVPPTGLESNHTTPYGLMVGAAGVAGAALVGSVVVRRRRRRQE